MKKRYWIMWLLSLVLAVIIFRSTAYALDDEIRKGPEYHARLNKIKHATYVVLTLCFYSLPEKNDLGKIAWGGGGGFAYQTPDSEQFFISAKHVLDPDDTYQQTLRRRGKPYIFLFPDLLAMYKVKHKLDKYYQKHKTAEGWNTFESYEKIAAVFKRDLETAILLDHAKLKFAQGDNWVEEAAYIPIDKKDRQKVNFVTRDYVAKKLDLSDGQEVQIYGRPLLRGEYLREGIISCTDLLLISSYIATGEGGTEFLRYGEYAVTSIIINNGDSGHPFFAQAEGKLKIIGITVLSPFWPYESPRLSAFYKIDVLFEKLGLK